MEITATKIRSLRQILNGRAKQSNGIRFSLTAYKYEDAKGTKLIEKSDVKNTRKINKFLEKDNFLRAEIDVFDLEKDEINPQKNYIHFNENFNFSDYENPLENNEIRKIENIPKNNELPRMSDNMIEDIANARFKEWKYQELERENAQLKKRIEELESDLDDAEDLIKKLKEKIESKENLKVYAELAGTILSNPKVKDKISDFLSGLSKKDEKNEEKKTSDAVKKDSSGVVEDPPTNINKNNSNQK